VAGSTRTRPSAVLLHGAAWQEGAIAEALDAEGIRVLGVAAEADALAGAELPTVLLLDETLARDRGDALFHELPDRVTVVALGAEAESRTPRDRLFMALGPAPEGDTLLRALQAAFRHAATRLAADRANAELQRTRAEVRELNEIGMALMTERDPERLLVQILDRAMSLTASDAGSLYLVETEGEERVLRFRLSANRSLPDLPFVEFSLPVDSTSIAGHVAATDSPLLLDDAYAPPADAPFAINRSFDERFGYRTQSMLVVPMTDHKGVVVGVVQLINRKRSPDAAITDEESARRHVLRYGEHELALVQGLAGQAAVSIENARLYKQIEDIFESFVKAAVTAIDQRDPTTAGHSVRVAALTTGLAERLPRLATGRWAGTLLSRDEMKELRYAALLHDFGKVGVREEVLVKSRKLPPHLWERVDARFDLARRTVETEYLRQKVRLLESGADREARDRVDMELEDRLQRLARFREAVRAANEPSVLPEEAAAILEDVAGERFEYVDGREVPLLEADEVAFLQIRKGSLNDAERLEIESHVTQTYRFLQQIPWTADLSRVAEIAYGHHEKLDGRGYPRRVTAREIPVQTRMMTIADIFDALTASDRPYKRAMGADRALDILRMEAKDGMLDDELVELLIESALYRDVLEKDWREL
jgi:HD-GYP domain-containing protein (c-di-GMP phosphodiesterase class II)